MDLAIQDLTATLRKSNQAIRWNVTGFHTKRKRIWLSEKKTKRTNKRSLFTKGTFHQLLLLKMFACSEKKSNWYWKSKKKYWKKRTSCDFLLFFLWLFSEGRKAKGWLLSDKIWILSFLQSIEYFSDAFSSKCNTLEKSFFPFSHGYFSTFPQFAY